MKNLELLLANWGLEDRRPRADAGTGAAHAKAVWHLGDDYSLKYGDDPEGLRHHIWISKSLKNNGITASCPLPTITGEDFVLDGTSYYVVTERVADNFLVAKETDPLQGEFFLDRYRREVENFRKALERGTQDFLEVLAWSNDRSASVATELGLPWPEVQEDAQEGELFICGTRIRGEVSWVLEQVGGETRGSALLALLTLFVAWTGTRADVAPICRGNIRLANVLRGQLRHQDI